MPKGTPLTIEQIAAGSKAFIETGNYSEAARRAGCDESALRRRLGDSKPKRAELNARATLAGIRRGRNALASITAEVRSKTRKGKRETLTAEQLLLYARTLHFTVGRLVSLVELALHERREKLTREKTRAEIDALKKGTLLTTEQLLAYLAALPREELLSLIATLKSRREASAAPAPPPAAPPPPPPEAT